MNQIKLNISLLFFLLLTVYCLLPTSATRASDSNKTIKAIEVEGLTRMKEEELIELVCFHVGDTLNEMELSAGIGRAFKKGVFLDIKAVSERYDDGIKLKYIVKEVPLIKEIIVNGNERVSTREIKRAFTFKEGEDLREEFLGRVESDLVSFYHRKGFLEAVVKVVVKVKETGMINLHLNIEEGTPLIVSSINVPADIKGYLTVSEGSVFDMELINDDIERIRDFYKEQNYLKPVVGPYKFHNGELTIPVTPGPMLYISFKGNTAVSTKRLMKEVTFLEDEDLGDEQIEEVINRMKMLYLSEGYYHIQIAVAIEKEEEVIRVNFIIFEGKRVVLKKIRFNGISIAPDIIKGIIPLKENEPYNAALLSSSEESLKMFYNALGYLRMEVVEVKEEFEEDGTVINLEFIVNEGPQTKIKVISLTGNEVIDTSKIRDALQLTEESLYNVVDIGDARHRVLSLYRRLGYLDVNVDVQSILDEDRAFLNFSITENKPSYVGKLIIRGNQKTKDKIIKREIILEEGMPYNYEKVLKSKQRLFKLGLFDEVSIEILDTETLEDSLDEKKEKHIRDMLVSVKEGNAGYIDVGIGYGDYERLRGSIEINYRNLGGYNRQIGFRTEMSNVEKRYILNFREPWLFNRPNLPFKLSLAKEDKRAINLDTKDVLYRIDKLSFIAGTEKELTRGLRASLNYEYSFVDTKDVEPGVILSKEDTGTLAISSISPSLVYDTRDNPFEPTSGVLAGMVLKFASKAYLSETEFIKGTFQGSRFFRLKKGIVFAISLRGGAAYVFGETEELPLVERFFLGGRTTVRGYSHDTLGPKGAVGSPTGGNIFALINGEFRIPLKKGFGMVTFVDAGNVWKLVGDISPDLRYTAGVGLRYSTPVGPVRVDYGHKLDREPGESTGEVHFSFGHAF